MLFYFLQYAYFCFVIEMKMTRVNHKDILNKTLISRTQRYSLPTIDAIYLQVLFVLKKQIMILIIWKFDREATCHPLSTMSDYRKKFIYLQIQTNLFCCVLFTFYQLKYFQFRLKDCCFFTVLWSVIILVSI